MTMTVMRVLNARDRMRWGDFLIDFDGFSTANGSRQGQDAAMSALFVPDSLDSERGVGHLTGFEDFGTENGSTESL